MHNNCLRGLMFSSCWRIAPTKTQIPMGIWVFGILYMKVLILQNVCEIFFAKT